MVQLQLSKLNTMDAICMVPVGWVSSYPDDLYEPLGSENSQIAFNKVMSANNQSLTVRFPSSKFFEIALTMDLSSTVLRRNVTVTITKITLNKV